MRLPFVLLGAVACGYAAADTGVVPNGWENTAGNSTFLYMVTGARSYQYIIHANQLTGFVGSNLNGLQWRLPTSSTSTWPPVDATFNNFDIYMGAGVDPASRSLTFANNFVGSPTQVRSGSLTFSAGSFSSTGSPRDWGPMVSFNDYLYTGGNLVIEIRHTGMTGNTTSRSFDAVGTSTSGYLTDFAAIWQGSYTPTSGSQGNFFITQLSATPVPEPASMIALAVGAGCLALRRRRK